MFVHQDLHHQQLLLSRRHQQFSKVYVFFIYLGKRGGGASKVRNKNIRGSRGVEDSKTGYPQQGFFSGKAQFTIYSRYFHLILLFSCLMSIATTVLATPETSPTTPAITASTNIIQPSPTTSPTPLTTEATHETTSNIVIIQPTKAATAFVMTSTTNIAPDMSSSTSSNTDTIEGGGGINPSTIQPTSLSSTINSSSVLIVPPFIPPQNSAQKKGKVNTN